MGEIYEAQREIENWKLPDFNEESWTNAKIETGPGGILQKAFFPPVQITETITPIDIWEQTKGMYLIGMGVNFTGTYKIKLSGNKGDTVIFRFGERIYENGNLNPMTTVCGQIKRKGVGGLGAPDIAWQTDSYIFKDNSEVWYQPEFTFHTYRYM